MSNDELTTLIIAQRRLKTFMDRHGSTIKECAVIMGHPNADSLRSLLKAKGSHPDDHNVMVTFGPDLIAASIRKLNELRGNKPHSCKANSEAETLPQLARRMYLSCREINGLDGLQVVERMNKFKPASVTREFTLQRLSVAISPSSLANMSESYAEDIMKSLAAMGWVKPMPEELMPYVFHVDGADAMAETATEAPAPAEVMQDADADMEDAVLDEGEAHEVVKQGGAGDAESVDLVMAKLFSDIEFTAEFKDKVKSEIARQLDDAVGITLDELKEIREQIGALVYARRMNVRAQVIVPQHTVG